GTRSITANARLLGRRLWRRRPVSVAEQGFDEGAFTCPGRRSHSACSREAPGFRATHCGKNLFDSHQERQPWIVACFLGKRLRFRVRRSSAEVADVCVAQQYERKPVGGDYSFRVTRARRVKSRA